MISQGPYAMDAAADHVRFAVRHARWRWSGAPLLVTGAVLFMWALGDLARGGTGSTVLLSVFGTGMALASFGANHDAAMAMAVRWRSEAVGPAAVQLPDNLRDELAEELERDRAGTLSLRASPKVALVLPFVTIAVQAWVASRLLG